jgi:hypothetical protein
MQPAIHQEKNPDIYRFDVRLFVAMYCGLHLLFIIPRESPCMFMLYCVNLEQLYLKDMLAFVVYLK